MYTRIGAGQLVGEAGYIGDVIINDFMFILGG